MVIFFLQVSFPPIITWVIICKYWTSCLSLALFATVLTSQAWPYCGICSYWHMQASQRTQACLFAFPSFQKLGSHLSLITSTPWICTSSDNMLTWKHFVRCLVHLIFPSFITEKEMAGSSIPQRECLYKNILSPKIGHFRLGDSTVMLIHVSKALLSANSSLFPFLKADSMVLYFFQ